ncbi:hypothetical protein BS47DRAFT_1383143 [Hydnum rufescens UP504]|uniref:Uncharacterized protein n=1 Tax=Hydnum rufescens UP504 TaxID=1448309 RepID=A0A9P6AUB1_9AGAM|nr:hypothetical protein BS47DRAFT_1383143 [Hydnum rufescens UP504]
MSRRLWKTLRHRDPTPSPQPSDSIPSGSTSIEQRISRIFQPDPSQLMQTPPTITRVRMDFCARCGFDRVRIPALPGALVGPVTQILDVLAEIRMRAPYIPGHEVFHLFVEDLRGSNIPIPDGSPTAVRLFALKSNLKAIKADVMRWSDLGLLDRYVKRDESTLDY